MKLWLSFIFCSCMASSFFVESSNFFHKKLMLSKMGDFSWQNCGKPDDPVTMKTLSLSPDPISIPGTLMADASASTLVALTSPVSVNVTLEREVAGLWVKIPCLDDLGSCHYPNVCDLLNQLIPPGQDCPEPLLTYGLPCHCPFKAGDYTLPSSDFTIPKVELPGWLAKGKYKVQGILGSSDKELGCLSVNFSLEAK